MTVLPRFRRFAPRRPSRLAAIGMVTLSLGGCAPAHVPWANPQLPKEQWSRDWSDCKRRAEADVLGYRPEDSTPGPLDTYDRSQARRQIDASVAECMSGLGYTPVRKEN